MYFESFVCWEPLQRNTFLLFSSLRFTNASSAIFCVVFVSLQPRLRHNLSHVVLWPRNLNTIIFTQKPNFCKLINSSIFSETV